MDAKIGTLELTGSPEDIARFYQLLLTSGDNIGAKEICPTCGLICKGRNALGIHQSRMHRRKIKNYMKPFKPKRGRPTTFR